MPFFPCGTHVSYGCWHKMAISTCIAVVGGAYEPSRLFTWKEIYPYTGPLNLYFGHFLVPVSKYNLISHPTPPHTEAMAQVSTCVLVCLRRDVLTFSYNTFTA